MTPPTHSPEARHERQKPVETSTAKTGSKENPAVGCRRASTFRPADVKRAVLAGFAAGANKVEVRVDVHTGDLVVTAEMVERRAEPPQDELDRELAEFEGRHGQV